MTEDDLKQIIIEVNSTLNSFECDYTSAARSPYGDRERVHSFRQFIECRLNYELFYCAELEPLVKYFNGNLFQVVSIIDENDDKKKLSYVEAELDQSCDSFENYDSDDEVDPQELIREIIDKLGGTRIRFNRSAKRPKIYIE